MCTMHNVEYTVWFLSLVAMPWYMDMVSISNWKEEKNKIASSFTNIKWWTVAIGQCKLFSSHCDRNKSKRRCCALQQRVCRVHSTITVAVRCTGNNLSNQKRDESEERKKKQNTLVEICSFSFIIFFFRFRFCFCIGEAMVDVEHWDRWWMI